MKKNDNFRKDPEKIMHNTLRVRNRLYTKNLIPGVSVYDERFIRFNNEEYREWNPKKSKIAAAILKSLKFEFQIDSKVLYLGASTGTTISHLSDIIEKGKIFGIEISARMLTQLVFLAEKRKNIFPIMGDANKPEEYLNIATLSDFVFQDVAQKNQVLIFIKNARVFLKKGGTGLLSLKTRSVDIKKKPNEIHLETFKELKKYFKAVEFSKLEPFEKDHYFYVCKGFKF